MNRAIVFVAICAGIAGISYGMHSPIVPVFARDQLAADYSQVGLIGTANSIFLIRSLHSSSASCWTDSISPMFFSLAST